VKVSELTNKFYTSLPTIRNAIYDRLVSSGYYLERPDKVKGKWFDLAVVTAFIGIGLAALYTKRAWVMISPFALMRPDPIDDNRRSGFTGQCDAAATQ
jgi:hypothetical protein